MLPACANSLACTGVRRAHATASRSAMSMEPLRVTGPKAVIWQGRLPELQQLVCGIYMRVADSHDLRVVAVSTRQRVKGPIKVAGC